MDEIETQSHSLVGKVVEVYHDCGIHMPYQPLVVLAIEWPMIQFGSCDESESNWDHDLSPFWVPLQECKRIVEVKK